MSLWLKSENTKTKTKWSVELINILPTFINLLTALSSWIGTTLAGQWGVVKFMSFGLTCAVFSEIVLTIWVSRRVLLLRSLLLALEPTADFPFLSQFVPAGLKFLAFYLGGFLGMVS